MTNPRRRPTGSISGASRGSSTVLEELLHGGIVWLTPIGVSRERIEHVNVSAVQTDLVEPSELIDGEVDVFLLRLRVLAREA